LFFAPVLARYRWPSAQAKGKNASQVVARKKEERKEEEEEEIE
jgi:hypothetical protein